MPVRLPSYVYRNRCGIFYFRVVLPITLATAGAQREFRLSLHTAERTTALGTAWYLGYRVAELFAAWTEMAKRKPRTTTPQKVDPEQFKAMLADARVKYNAIARVEELEAVLDQERDKARGVVKQAYAQGIMKGARLAQGTAPALPAAPVSPLVSQVIEDYIRYKDAKDKWTAKSKAENLAAFNLFVQIAGDMPIASVDHDITMGYVQTLKKLPPNMTKRFRSVSLADIIATNPQPISARTFNKNVERVSSLFKWALGIPKYRLTHNPAAGLSVDETGQEKRLPFTTDELIALFSSPEFTRREFQNSYAYWLMSLALFTGARLGELTQLYVTDIMVLDGVACFNISDEEEGQRLKNKNAKRLVPVHSRLIELGFLRHVDQLRAEGVKRLFPELNRRRDGFGHAASNWFQRYKRRCGVHGKHTKVFHSFRHSFISRLLDDGVAEHAIAKIVGHEAELITGKVYWNAIDARKRQPTVEAFKLPDEVMRLIPKVENVRWLSRRGPKRDAT